MSVGSIPEVEPLGHWISMFSAYLDAAKHTFRVFVAVTLPPAIPEHSSGSMSQLTFGIICSYELFCFHFNHPGLCGNTSISPLTKDIENFQTLLAIEISSFMKCLLKSLPT